MTRVQLKRLRLGAYSALTASMVVLVATMKFFGGVDNAHPVMLWMVTALAAFFVILVVFDSVYHATTKNSLCIHCGGSRRMQSFRFSGECPHCGK